MSELFLIATTILTAMMKGSDKLPAALFCLISYVQYFAVGLTKSDDQIFFMGAISDVILIALMVCLNGCLRSRITFFLIPIGVLSIVMHFYGWMLYTSGQSMATLNTIIVFYWCIIISLFLSRCVPNGDIGRHSRFLRGANSGNKNVAMVSK